MPDKEDATFAPTRLVRFFDNRQKYVAQIDNKRMEEALSSTRYLDTTAKILHKRDGLWFNDESFVVSKRRG